MRILQHFLVGLPVAILWMILTEISIEAGIIGYLIGTTLSWLLSQGRLLPQPSLTSVPQRTILFLIYSLKMALDILLSGIDVTLRIIGIREPKPGIVAVPVQNEEEDNDLFQEVIAGLSAHSITITPGELVVDYSDDHKIMYVHALDVEISGKKTEADQARRVKQFRRILGRD